MTTKALKTTLFSSINEMPIELARMLFQEKNLGESLRNSSSYTIIAEQYATARILDIQSNGAGWGIETAHRFQRTQVVGVHSSSRFVSHARSSALVSHVEDNTVFLEMDTSSGYLQFPDASFDVIHAQLLYRHLASTSWPLFLQECSRVLRPGGALFLAEPDQVNTNSPVVAQLCEYLSLLLQREGYGFRTEGISLGMADYLFLSNDDLAPFRTKTVQAHSLHWSLSSPYGAALQKTFLLFLQSALPLLIEEVALDLDALERLVRDAHLAMMAEDFQAETQMLTLLAFR